MARVVITTWGSFGDVNPYLGLATALRARGHVPVMAMPSFYGATIREAGFEFAAVEPDADPALDPALLRKVMDPRRGTEAIFREILLPHLPAAHATLMAAVQGADFMITHPAALAAPIVAEQTGIPWLSTVLSPLNFMSAYDPILPPPATWVRHLPWWVLLKTAPWVADAGRQVTSRWMEPLQAFRGSLGLPRAINPIFEGQHSPYGTLAMYSKVFGGPFADWPQQVTVTGQLRYDVSHGAVLSPEIERFLDAGEAPIVFTLGSSVVLIAEQFWDECLDATRRMGCRAILLAGPVQSARLQGHVSSNVLVVDAAPHSLLFPRAAAIVQPCGIGTTGTALASGRPQLAVPYTNDQPDNAWRLSRLGVARMMSPRAYRGRAVARELTTLLSAPGYRQQAEALAAVVAGERGAELACDRIEALL